MKTFLEHILLTEDRVSVIQAKFEPLYFKLYYKYIKHENQDNPGDHPVGSEEDERQEWIKPLNQWPKIAREIPEIDPTPNKVYTQWLFQVLYNVLAQARNIGIGWYEFYRSIDEDAESIKQDLVTFDRVKARMPANQRDINQYKTHTQLRTAIEPYEQTVSKAEEDREYIKKLYDTKQITLVYKGPEGKVEIPHTIKASKFLGRGTKWCTAAENNNYFDGYNKKGPLLVYTIAEHNTKWQFHIETNSYMDARDVHIVPEVMAAVKLVKVSAKYVFPRVKITSTNVEDIIRRFGVDQASPLMLDLISENASLSIKYAIQLRKRFMQGEKSILRVGSGLMIGVYAKYIMKSRWPEAEKHFLGSRELQSEIHNMVIYSIITMNGSWPEAESLARKFKMWEKYQEELTYYASALQRDSNTSINQWGKVV